MTKYGVLFIMGVSGSGKSTIGKQLAKELELPFFDGDDYHPAENVKKMSEGKPLNDEDRQGWLERLNELGKEHGTLGAVIVCSALKESYRIILGQDLSNKHRFIYLEGSFDLINARLSARQDHFMPPNLLKSQFNTLEIPSNAIHVSIDQRIPTIIDEIRRKL